LKVLSRENGLVVGYVGRVGHDKLSYQVGNLVKFTWIARQITQLGTIRIEVLKSYIAALINSRIYLSLIEGITILIGNLLYENYLPDEILFLTLQNILEFISVDDDKYKIMREYLFFENTLLNVLGGGIILDNEKLENLFYISPKSGLAVSKLKGEPYKNKLLIFPEIFRTDVFNEENIKKCFAIMGFFLEKFLKENPNLRGDVIMDARERLIRNL
jgi:DNA repair protein RecO (recombination protein O)